MGSPCVSVAAGEIRRAVEALIFLTLASVFLPLFSSLYISIDLRLLYTRSCDAVANSNSALLLLTLLFQSQHFDPAYFAHAEAECCTNHCYSTGISNYSLSHCNMFPLHSLPVSSITHPEPRIRGLSSEHGSGVKDTGNFRGPIHMTATNSLSSTSSSTEWVSNTTKAKLRRFLEYTNT